MRRAHTPPRCYQRIMRHRRFTAIAAGVLLAAPVAALSVGPSFAAELDFTNPPQNWGIGTEQWHPMKMGVENPYTVQAYLAEWHFLGQSGLSKRVVYNVPREALSN